MCSGLRSPGGIAFNAEGDVFYAESQGPWASANTLKQLRPDGFMGHPISNKWWARAGKPLVHDAAYYTLNQIPKM